MLLQFVSLGEETASETTSTRLSQHIQPSECKWLHQCDWSSDYRWQNCVSLGGD